jgi:uncharacterized protein YndB with AHSA1/START domain
MEGRRQLERTTEIEAPVTLVWEVLSDSSLLPQWVPAVQEVVACSTEGERVGAVRKCDVELMGREGHMVERCVEFTPMSRAAYVVDDESFGLRKMFADYGFALNLRASGTDRTTVRIETHYTPRNLLYSIMSAVMMRRRFAIVVDALLAGLKSLSERRALISLERGGGVQI